MAATLSIQQVRALMAMQVHLREAFKGMNPKDVTEVVSLIIDGRPPLHPGSKSDQLIEMLSRPTGATVDEVVDTFGIKKNSAYARISVETRRRKLKVNHVDGHYHVHA